MILHHATKHKDLKNGLLLRAPAQRLQPASKLVDHDRGNRKNKSIAHSPVLAKQQRRRSSSQEFIFANEYASVLLSDAGTEAEKTVGVERVCGVGTL